MIAVLRADEAILTQTELQNAIAERGTIDPGKCYERVKAFLKGNFDPKGLAGYNPFGLS
jgi:hypothetical protein